MKTTHLFVTLLCVLFCLTHADVPTYQIINLNAVSGLDIQPAAINDSGYITGDMNLDPQNGVYHTLFYDGTTFHDLGTLGGKQCRGTDINSSGQIAGHGLTASGYQHVAFYDGTTLNDIGSLTGGYARGEGINDHGHIVGTSSTAVSGIFHAYLYDGTTMHDLGDLGGSSYAYAINNNGYVTGYSYLDTYSGDTHAFLYDGTRMHDLGTLGGDRSWAEDINSLGHVVGYSWTGRSGLAAFFYNGSRMYDIGSLGGNVTYAYAINDHDVIVGRSEPILNSAAHAFVYDGQTMLDLNNLIPANSGWLLETALDINNAGQIIGTGKFNGENHSFLLTPIPEPATLLLLGMGGLLLRKR